MEKLAGEKGRATWFYLENEKIRVGLREATLRIERERSASEKKWREQNPSGYWFRYCDPKPTGKLVFTFLSNGREENNWFDGKGKRLEDRINRNTDSTLGVLMCYL